MKLDEAAIAVLRASLAREQRYGSKNSSWSIRASLPMLGQLKVGSTFAWCLVYPLSDLGSVRLRVKTRSPRPFSVNQRKISNI